MPHADVKSAFLPQPVPPFRPSATRWGERRGGWEDVTGVGGGWRQLSRRWVPGSGIRGEGLTQFLVIAGGGGGGGDAALPLTPPKAMPHKPQCSASFGILLPVQVAECAHDGTRSLRLPIPSSSSTHTKQNGLAKEMSWYCWHQPTNRNVRELSFQDTKTLRLHTCFLS